MKQIAIATAQVRLICLRKKLTEHVAVHESAVGPKRKCRTIKRMSDIGGEADVGN